jgi:hypothetical protein
MRAREVIRPVAERGLPEAADLAEGTARRAATGSARRCRNDLAASPLCQWASIAFGGG